MGRKIWGPQWTTWWAEIGVQKGVIWHTGKYAKNESIPKGINPWWPEDGTQRSVWDPMGV